MSELYIKGNGDFPPIPVNDFYGQLNPDLSQCSYMAVDYVPGTSSDPNELWGGQGAYFRQTGVASNIYNNAWFCMSGTNQTSPDPSIEHLSGLSGNKYHAGQTKLFIYSVRTGTTEQNDLFYVYWDIADDFADVGFNTREYQMLYSNTWSNATSQSGFITEDRDWDESPNADRTDPKNLNASGGEFADTDPFNLTNNISLTELEALLDSIATLDYGGLIQPVILSQTEILHNMTDLNEGLFLADFWTNLKNKFSGLSDPLSMILDSVELPYRPAGDGGTLKLGGIQVQNGQGGNIPVFKLTRRYEKRKIGSVTLKEVWGTEKDYSQCSVQIYLPYVGVRDIDTDLAINNTLTLYAVHDMWNGDVLYILHCSNSASQYKYMTSEFVAYRWNGNCGKKVPLGRVDNTTPIMSLLSMARNSAVGFAGGGVIGALGMGGMTALNSNFNPTVQSSGNLSGSTGRMDIQYPYFILKRSVPIYPNNWRSEIGAPRYQEFQVSDLSGYTEFYEIHADDVSDATDSEKAEIENLLKNGVFIA